MKRSILIYFSSLAIALTSLAVLSLLQGAYHGVTLGDVIDYLLGKSTGHPGVLSYRARRTLAALIVGAGLGASGLAMQYALRNPLADPYLLGVSSGAALGVLIAYALRPSPGPYMIFSLALALGVTAFSIVLLLGATAGGTPAAMIVSGVSVSYAFMGASIFLMVRELSTIQGSMLWLFGTVAYVTGDFLTYTTAIVLTGSLILLALSAKAYTLVLGDEVSTSLGVNVKRLRIYLLTVSSIMASVLVALTGPVGFIGLVAPWISRLAVGSRFSLALAASIMTGAALTLASDVTVRMVASPSEVPLTAVTALFGGPVLFYLTRKTGW